MSSKPESWDAPRFTMDYSQPEAYRFSLDSVLLAKAVVRDLTESARLAAELTCLDLCAGCGVVGLELHILNPSIARIDFAEVQSVYAPHFATNLQAAKRVTGRALQAEWLPYNYKDLWGFDSADRAWSERYDLIVSNPPYFEKDQGLIPPDEFKARCRFFLDSDFQTLWTTTLQLLKPQGEAYVLVREQSDHGRKRHKQILQVIEGRADIVRMEDLRGTLLYRIRKR